MSEPIPGVPRPGVPAGRPREAAVAILHRVGAAGPELFWLRRGAKLSFAGGFYAFPGGRVDDADAQAPVRGATGEQARRIAAAARELFEETGVLAAGGAAALDPAGRAHLRRALLDGKVGWAALLDGHHLTLDAEDFLPAGRWVTPPFLPGRFDAHLFLVQCPPDQAAEVWPGELADGEWVAPTQALGRWSEGTALLHPPNLHVLRAFAQAEGQGALLQRLRNPPACVDHVPSRIEFQQGIQLFPLKTDTLPPATHTNLYLLGNRELLLVDPGAGEEAELNRFADHLASLAQEGLRAAAIFLTHHHGDHVSGAQWLRRRFQLPLWCHPLTSDRLEQPADRLVQDGEVLTLDGDPPMRWRALHTPGHARGHLCLVDERSRSAVVGDMVAGVGTIVIDPPEGDMADYLHQLRRLKDLPVTALYPAHGPALPDGPAKLEEYLQHRAMREQLVLGALGEQLLSLAEVVVAAYADTPPFMHPVAERSALAILLKLERERKVRREGERFARV